MTSSVSIDNRISSDASQGSRMITGLFMMIACLISLAAFIVFAAIPCYADTVNITATYGYQNTAKAGHYLPLKIELDNTGEDTYSGTIHVYMAASEKSLYEYKYQKTVEGNSSGELDVTLSLSTGVNQLLITAEDRQGVTVGSRRIGLDVAGSDVGIIIGLLSDKADQLSYLNDVGINDGILKTHTVILDESNIPEDATELDQLDVLLISGFQMNRMKQNEADAINKWVSNGGILILGTGELGNRALQPYFGDILSKTLMPEEMQVYMGEDTLESQNILFPGAQEETADAWTEIQPKSDVLSLTASPVYLIDGKELFFTEVVPIVSLVSKGAGVIAVSGYDFCDLQRYGTEQSAYVDRLLSEILGRNRLNHMSVTASEKSLNDYWDIQELMNMSNADRVPRAGLYAFVLICYVVLVGPGLYFFTKEHEIERVYRITVFFSAVLVSVLIYVMGAGTRYYGRFLTYAKVLDVSEESIDERSIINLRSSDESNYNMDVKTEYYAYPILKGTDFNGDITNLIGTRGKEETAINFGRDKTVIEVKDSAPFDAKYFELDNKIPNDKGSFVGEVNYQKEKLTGTITNNYGETLTDAAVLMYGHLVKLGKLDPGQTIDLSTKEMSTIPVGDYRIISKMITPSSGQKLLEYYLSQSLNGYYQGARLIGFQRDSEPDFTADTDIDTYGVTMVVSALDINTHDGRQYSYSAMSRDPEVITGDYDISDNTISGTYTTELRYHLGDDVKIQKISMENLHSELISNYQDATKEEVLIPFRGSVSLYNYNTGGYDALDIGDDGTLEGVALTPYLNSDNVLDVRFVPKEQSTELLERSYLPMFVITASE